ALDCGRQNVRRGDVGRGLWHRAHREVERAARALKLDGPVQRMLLPREVRERHYRLQVVLPADRAVEVDLARVGVQGPRTGRQGLGRVDAPAHSRAGVDLDRDIDGLLGVDVDRDRGRVLHRDTGDQRPGGDVQSHRRARLGAYRVDG